MPSCPGSGAEAPQAPALIVWPTLDPRTNLVLAGTDAASARNLIAVIAGLAGRLLLLSEFGRVSQLLGSPSQLLELLVARAVHARPIVVALGAELVLLREAPHASTPGHRAHSARLGRLTCRPLGGFVLQRTIGERLLLVGAGPLDQRCGQAGVALSLVLALRKKGVGLAQGESICRGRRARSGRRGSTDAVIAAVGEVSDPDRVRVEEPTGVRHPAG
jgi:hypothetical protein